MHDGKLPPGPRLDWREIQDLVEEKFEGQDKKILQGLYGLAGQQALEMKELRKLTDLNKKKFQDKVKRLENQLFRLLKDEKPGDIFLDEPGD